MEQGLLKAVTELIDETLEELEELKKSERFSASEIKLKGPGSGIAGKDSNGELEKEEDEEEEEREAEEEEAEKEAEMEETKKAEDKDEEGVNVEKADKEDDEDEEDDNKRYAKKKHKHDIECEVKKEESCEGMKKSYTSEDVEELKKSYDSQLTSMAEQIEKLQKSIRDIADAPVERKGVAYSNVEALEKSEPEPEPLVKSQVVDKLISLKKSGENVLTEDICSLDFGGQDQLQKIANKYGLK